ncbi:protein S100-A11-like [Plectropomus leopardus]|uniref:protein S100-A11-like n=1 Tax=Plectropomus leopardus TaxID=160734 RepID=UPI001C4A87C5|nr:protein S100-A11-like [Plectropomus leopardus]XP_042345391.1 protein S100-A11-like [Plectropomus leopardus]
MALEKAISDLVELFLSYADGDGKLSQDELKKMLEKEIENPEVKEKMTKGDCDKIFGKMDKNCSGQIEFREFVMCVGKMLKCHYHKKTGRVQDDDGGCQQACK